MTTKDTIELLLISDDDTYGEVCKMVEEVNEFHISLDHASKYDMAMGLIQQQKFDLYLVSRQFCGHSGIGMMQSVLNTTDFIPFIALVETDDFELEDEAFNAGAIDCIIMKHLTPFRLRKTLRLGITNARFIMELHQKEKRYKNLFEQSEDAIFITNRDQLFVDVNQSFIKLFGYDMALIKSMTIKDLFQKKEAFVNMSEQLLKARKVNDFDAHLKTNLNQAIECNISMVALYNEEDEFAGYQGLLRDISLRKKAERELLLAEKFSMTGRIARSIAHEVRNPLTNLNLALEQLKDEIAEGNSDRESVELYTDIIQRNAGRIDALIKDMLNSSKPRELDLADYDINEILEEVVQLTADRLKLQGMQVKRQYASELPKISSDKEKLKVAFLNIIVNAIEAMEVNKGKLSLRTYFENGRVMVEIADNGKGISDNDLKALFDPFFTGKRSGMGLGLTTSKNIMNSHSGHIEVTSEIGQGTVFSLSFEIGNTTERTANLKALGIQSSQ